MDSRKIKDFGIGTHIKSFLSTIGKKDLKNLEFKLIFKEKYPNCPFENYIFPFGEYHPFSFFFFGIFTRKIDHDILYIPHFNYSPFSRSTIITIHDLIPLRFKDFYKNKRGYFFYKFYLFYSLKKAKKIFVVSETTKEEVIKFFPFSREKIIKIPNSTDPLFYEKYNFKKENYFLFIGNNKPHKNINLLIAFWKNFSKEFPNYKLYIISPIEIKEENVVILKNLITKDLIEILGKAKVFISPSLWEGFNLPLLESVLLETPPLVSSIPANEEILGKDYPYFFNPRDEGDLKSKLSKILWEYDFSLNHTKVIKEKLIYKPENMASKIIENLSIGTR